MLKQEPLFWNSSRIRRISFALVISFFLVFTFSFFVNTPADGMLSRGDFPAFYVSGILANSENPNDVYNLKKQSELQSFYWPQMKGKVLSFAYPPFVAQALVPFSFLPAMQAKFVFSILMLACLLLVVKLICDLKEDLNGNYLKILVAFLCFAPILAGIFSGQNTALSMLLLLFGCSSLIKKKEVSAGVSFGLLAFKPHYGLIALLALLFSKNFKAASYFIITCFVLYIFAASVYGFDWPYRWLQSVSMFAVQDRAANQHQTVSLIGFLGTLSPNLLVVGYVCSALTLVAYLFTVFKHENPNLFLTKTLGALIVFVSPHTLFYDMGIAVASVPLYMSFSNDKKINLLLFILALVFILSALKASLFIQPLFFLVAFLLVQSWRSKPSLSYLNY